MVKVRGQFDVTLTTSITVYPDVKLEELSTCEFSIDDNQVAVRALRFTDLVDYGDGSFDFPKLTDIRVWITRNLNLMADKQNLPLLSREDEDNFERVLIDATRRLMTALKQKIGQWNLDTRHPVYAYTYKYFVADRSLSTTWILPSGQRKMPEYSGGVISLETHGELTDTIWDEITQLVKSPVNLPAYDEFLHDARTFRSNMQYDTAILFSAVAAEVILEETCRKSLKAKGNLTDSQCDAILADRRIPSLGKLVKELQPNIDMDGKQLEWLFKQRNRIAHGVTRISTWQDAAKAIRTTVVLKSKFIDILTLPN